MATVTREITYRCSDDCLMAGCPTHQGKLMYHSVSDVYEFSMNDKKLVFERGELAAMIQLLRDLDRADAVQI